MSIRIISGNVINMPNKLGLWAINASNALSIGPVVAKNVAPVHKLKLYIDQIDDLMCISKQNELGAFVSNCTKLVSDYGQEAVKGITGMMAQPTCLANSTEALESLVCEVPGITPYEVPYYSTYQGLASSITENVVDVSTSVVEGAAEVVESAAYSNTAIALGALAAVAVSSAAVYGAYSLYNYMNQPVVEVEPAVEIKPVVEAPDVIDCVEPVVEVVEPTVKEMLAANLAAAASLEATHKKLDLAGEALTSQALGSVEVNKIADLIAEAKALVTLATKKDANAEDIKQQAKDIESGLASVSFEGKGVQVQDMHEVSYFKRAVIAVTEALQYVFSLIGQFMSEDKNPVAEALLGCSFFLSAPMTAREDAIVESAKDAVIAAVTPA